MESSLTLAEPPADAREPDEPRRDARHGRLGRRRRAAERRRIGRPELGVRVHPVAAAWTSRAAGDVARVAAARGRVSAREVLDAHLRRIDEVNPAINAIVTLVPERARAEATAADERSRAGRRPARSTDSRSRSRTSSQTAGIRTTFGSPSYADHVPDDGRPPRERIRAAGAIVIGKTNTPEWGAGSHTFNPVFGTTRNPLRPRRDRRADPPEARPRRSRPAWCRSPTGAISAGRSATPRRSAASWGSGPRRAGCHRGRPTTRSTTSPSRGRWGGRSRTPRCCSRRSPAPTRGSRARSPSRARRSRRRWTPTSPASRIAWAPACGGTMPFDARVVHVGATAARRRPGAARVPTRRRFPDLARSA